MAQLRPSGYPSPPVGVCLRWQQEASNLPRTRPPPAVHLLEGGCVQVCGGGKRGCALVSEIMKANMVFPMLCLNSADVTGPAEATSSLGC